MSWLYDGLAERWVRWLPTAALAEVTYLKTRREGRGGEGRGRRGDREREWSLYLTVQYSNAGYYTTTTPDGVRIISMNTNLGCNNENFFLSFPSSESADPDNQLHWFVDTLDMAEKNQEKVYL